MKRYPNFRSVIAILAMESILLLDCSTCFAFLIAGKYTCASNGSCLSSNEFTQFQACANAVFGRGKVGAALSDAACGDQGACPNASLICKYEPPFFIHLDGTYSKSSEQGTFKIIGDLIDFSESKIRGVGHIADTGNSIVFVFINPFSTVPGDEIRSVAYTLVAGSEEGVITGTGSGTGSKTLKPPVNVAFTGGPDGFIDPEKGVLGTFAFTPQTTGKVNIKIVTPQSKEIDSGSMDATAGVATAFTWDGRSKDGNDPVASGIYIIRIEGPDFRETKKIAVIK